MMSGLLVRISELEQRRLTVSFSEERDADGQIVGGESGRYRDRSRIDKERVQRGHRFARLVIAHGHHAVERRHDYGVAQARQHLSYALAPAGTRWWHIDDPPRIDGKLVLFHRT